MNELFDEIKEDIEKQRLDEIWKRYGIWLVGGAVGIIVLTAIVVLIQNHHISTQKSNGNAFYTTINTLTKHPEDVDALTHIQDIIASDSAYAPFARLHYGSYLAKEQKHEAVIDVLQEGGHSATTHPFMRDYLRILGFAHSIADNTLDEDAYEQLTFMAQPTKPLRALALEILFLDAVKQQKWDVARDYAQDIEDDTTSIPPIIQQRVAAIRYSFPPETIAAHESDSTVSPTNTTLNH